MQLFNGNSGINVNVNHRHILEDVPVKSPLLNSETPKLTVESLNNHVYFYADVDTDRTLALIRSLRGLDEMLRNERMSRDVPPDVFYSPIWLHVQSGGGDAFAGFAAANQIEEIGRRTPIYAVAEGMVASAATFIFLACNKRYVLPNTFFLIHQVSAWKFGLYKYDESEDDLALQKKIMKQMVDFYTAHTALSEEAVREMLKRNTWLDAGEALDAGIVHEVRG